MFTTYKMSEYRGFSGSYFHIFGLKTEIFSLNTGKYESEKKSVLGQFSYSVSKNKIQSEIWKKRKSRYFVYNEKDIFPVNV